MILYNLHIFTSIMVCCHVRRLEQPPPSSPPWIGLGLRLALPPGTCTGTDNPEYTDRATTPHSPPKTPKKPQ